MVSLLRCGLCRAVCLVGLGLWLGQDHEKASHSANFVVHAFVSPMVGPSHCRFGGAAVVEDPAKTMNRVGPHREGGHPISTTRLELGFVDRALDRVQNRLVSWSIKTYQKIGQALPERLRGPAKRIAVWAKGRITTKIVSVYDKVGILRLDGASYSALNYSKKAVAGDNVDGRTFLAQRNGFVAVFWRPEGFTFSVCKAGLTPDGNFAIQGRVNITGDMEDDTHLFIPSRVPQQEPRKRDPSWVEHWENKETGQRGVVYVYDSDKLRANLQATIRDLIDTQCMAISSSCGFMQAFQEMVVEFANDEVPVLMSSCSLLPLVAQSVQGDIMILTANSNSFHENKDSLVGNSVDETRLVIVGLQDLPGFGDEVAAGTTVNATLAETGIVQKVNETLIASDHSIKAILSECTELPGYTNTLREAFGLPVVDALTVCNSMMQALLPRRGLGEFAHQVASFDQIQDEIW